MKAAANSRRRRSGAALLSLALALLCLLPAAAPAWADEAGPGLEVLEVGWDGHTTTGAWAPVRVKLTGAGRDLDALVEVTLENEYQTGPTEKLRYPTAAYAQEISLPASGSKEVTLWVPTGHNMVGTVRLKAGDQVAASEEIKLLATKAPYWPLVGTLSDQEELAAWLGKIELPLQNLPTAINVARLNAQTIPTLAARMKGLRAVVVQGNAPSVLSDEQRAAILAWVEGGGHLLLAGGPDSALSAAVLPAGTLPITFGGAEMNVDLTPLLTWAGVEGSLQGPAVRLESTGGSVLAGTPDHPLAWRMPVGMGTVTVLAVDPTLEPLASLDPITPLLRKGLSPALFDEMTSEEEKMRMLSMEQDSAYRLRNAIDALPVEAYPGWQQVALYLGGFALLAGPVLHLLFWRNQRRGWVWLAVPAASLVVAGGIYLAGVTLGGRDLLGHTLSHVQIDPESGTASQTMMVGLYAPMQEELVVTVDGEAPVNAFSLQNYGFDPRTADPSVELKPPFRVVQGRETRMEFNTGSWAMRPLSLSRTLSQEAGRITSHLTLEGSVLKGSITNETPYQLEHAAVAVGTKVAKLGTLAPGETAEVTLDPSGAVQPFHYYSIPMLFFGEPIKDPAMRGMAPTPPGAMEPMEIPSDPEIARRSRMIDSLLQQPSRGPDSISLPLTFVAFTREPVGAEVVDLEGHSNHHLSLIQQPLQLELPDGPYTIPSAIIPSRMEMVNVRGMGSSSNGKITWMEIDSGSAVFSFTPPIPGEAKLTALEVSTLQMGPPAQADGARTGPMPNQEPEAAEGGIFQIYNWSTAAWESLPGGQESVRLTEVAPYLSPTNQVKVQAVSRPGVRIQFVAPSLTLEGRGGE